MRAAIEWSRKRHGPSERGFKRRTDQRSSFRSVAVTSTFTFFDNLSDKDFCKTSHDGQDGRRDGLTEHLVHELGFHTRFEKISSLFS